MKIKLVSLLILATSLTTGQSAKIVTILRAEAAKRHLMISVNCAVTTGKDDPNQYIAAAYHEGDTLLSYIEDGAKPRWYVFGKTPEQAAARLLVAIRGKETDIPGHKENEQKEKKSCPDIRIGFNNIGR